MLGYTQVHFTEHAILRCSQRNIGPDEVLYIIEHGEKKHRTGIRYYILRRCDIPREDLACQRIAQLIGTSVLTDKHGNVIITVRRNGDAWKKDRRKTKYAWPHAAA